MLRALRSAGVGEPDTIPLNAQAAGKAGPPDQRDLKSWAPTQAATIEGRETGLSDSWTSILQPLLKPAADPRPSPDRISPTGLAFGDWLLNSAARTLAVSTTPVATPWSGVGRGENASSSDTISDAPPEN